MEFVGALEEVEQDGAERERGGEEHEQRAETAEFGLEARRGESRAVELARVVFAE